MRRIATFLAAQALVLMLVLVALPGDALLDDFEQDFWLPFTHFNLGDRASARYVDGVARSGDRSYRVAIQGWTLRDFGSAYGYAIYATSGSALSRLRVALLHGPLSDTTASPWDGFLAGVGLQLLDPGYRVLGTYRYVTAYRASVNAGRCGPTLSDIVLEQSPAVGSWIDVGRNPAADFPAAAWPSAAFVKVSIGFLCASGLTGADYRLHFDDFAIDTDLGDRDGDGIDDLEEETRRFVTEIAWTRGPLPIPDGGTSTVILDGPRVSGTGREGFLRIELEHPQSADLSVSLIANDEGPLSARVLWDPGFHARTLAVLSPTPGAHVRGVVPVSGRMPADLVPTSVFLRVDGVPLGEGIRVVDGMFETAWDTDAVAEGAHVLRVESPAFPDASRDIPLTVDRSPPDLRIAEPSEGAILRGLSLVEAQAFDIHGVDVVELWIDGARVDARHEEPFVFPYDTADLTNDLHTFDVRARDRAGNTASRSVRVAVSNDAPAVLPPCLPACNLSSGTDSGDLAPPSGLGPSKIMRLASGDLVMTSEVLRVPWTPSVLETPSGLSLTLDLLRPPSLPESQGVVSPGLGPDDLASIATWRIVVTDHRGGNAGSVVAASLLLATRLSAVRDDTDGDGLGDGDEKASGVTSPVLADGDADGLRDSFELTAHSIEFIVEGRPEIRSVRTNAADGDTDRDGLRDGEELASLGEGITDPSDPDTDRDTLTDGAERTVYGSNPTLRNTDGDGFEDGYEVRPRDFALHVDGVLRHWELTTSPILADTDDDRLRDDLEELAPDGGTRTHPALADTDEDGLNDSEEVRIGVDGFETRALQVDSDGDRVWDTFDKLPNDGATVTWTEEYPPGLVRFDQDFRVFWLEGRHATTTRRFPDLETGGYLCLELGDDVAGSTKTSDVTEAKVVSTINEMFAQAEETRYEATRSVRVVDGFRGFSSYSETIGSCPGDENEYFIEYFIHEDTDRTSFRSVEPVTIHDDDGRPFSYAFVPLPVDLGRTFSVVLQFSIDAIADRSHFSTYDSWLAPAFTYALFSGPDPAMGTIIHSGVSFATELNEFAYRVELRIPGRVLNRETVTPIDNVPMVGLYFSPAWVGRSSGAAVRDALNPANLQIASISTERPELVYSLVVRLDRDDQDLLLAEAEALSARPSGFYTVGAARVYVFRESAAAEMDPTAIETADAILLVSQAESDLFAVRDEIDWGEPGGWYRGVTDPWGHAIKAFRDSIRVVRSTVFVTQFIDLIIFRYAEPGTYLIQADTERLILLEKGELGGSPVYVISRADNTQEFLVEASAAGEVVVRKQLVYQVTTSEITTDLTTSRILQSRYSQMKTVLRGLAAGAILVSNGREVVIAFRDGDFVTALAYGTTGTLGIIGVFKGETRLVDIFAPRSPRLGALKVGSLATAAAGVILAGLELGRALGAPDELTKRHHLERSAGSSIDTALSLVPLYGSAVLLSWSVTHLAFSILLPDDLASRITSSPGGAVVFLFEYFLTGVIPSEIARLVLENALDTMILHIVHNAIILGIPSVLILP